MMLKDSLVVDFTPVSQWDVSVWNQIRPIYEEAFPEQGKKTERIFRESVLHQQGLLHTATVQDEVVGMAFTGISHDARALLIDYIAIAARWRGRGIGSAFLYHLKRWAMEQDLLGVIVEVEYSDDIIDVETTPRVRFWRKHDFHLTDYVHTYAWVPERYQAMYCNLTDDAALPDDGQALFNYITQFHKVTYRYRNS